MTIYRAIAGAVAGVLGLVVGIVAVFLAGFLTSQDSPSTDLNSVNPTNGFVQGSVDYGSRGGAGENN